MAAAPIRLRQSVIDEIRQRIDVVRAVENINDHLNKRKFLSKEDIKVCELALKHSLPAMKQIEGDALVDKSITIQVIKFSNDNHLQHGSQSIGLEAQLASTNIALDYNGSSNVT